ncbi:MAG: hypothetical protein QOH21_2790 [Acidobacteriota bacterium]|nr:hypothetical protein [Acidobacteriota bacterium]
MITTIEPNDPETPISPEEATTQIRSMRQRTKGFVQLRREEEKSIRRAAAVNPEFRKVAADAISTSDQLSKAVDATGDTLRAEEEDIQRWESVLSEVDAFRAGIISTIKLRKHNLGRTTLQAYAIAQQFVRNGHIDLIPHVDAMRRELRTARRRPAATTAAVVTPPPPLPPKS